jgi:hypothetical protein
VTGSPEIAGQSQQGERCASQAVDQEHAHRLAPLDLKDEEAGWSIIA